MKYYGICPASCGEFVQGVMDRAEYLCSYAVDLYSTAEVEEKLNNINLGPLKSRKAIEAVFKKFNIPVEESKNISLKMYPVLHLLPAQHYSILNKQWHRRLTHKGNIIAPF